MKLVIAFAVLFLASAARADSTSVLYDINGSMTLGGDANCPSCAETINYSFMLDVSATDCPISIPECIVGAVTDSQSGPLGTFVSEDRLLPDHGIYLAFDAPGLDQIDMYLGLSNGVPFAMPSNLWSCLSATCQADFSAGDDYQFQVANEFTAVDPVATPEPATWLEMLAGLVLVIALWGIYAS